MSGVLPTRSAARIWQPVQELELAPRVGLRNEGRRYLTQSRAFKQELVDRKIDAADASRAIVEIDAELKKCGA